MNIQVKIYRVGFILLALGPSEEEIKAVESQIEQLNRDKQTLLSTVEQERKVREEKEKMLEEMQITLQQIKEQSEKEIERLKQSIHVNIILN